MTGIAASRRIARPAPERRVISPLGWPLLGGAVALVLWQLAAMSGLETRRILPGPIAVLAAVPETVPVIAANAPTTLLTAGAGWLIGTLVAAAMGMLVALWPRSGSLLLPLAIVADSLPVVALAPILVIVSTGIVPGVVMAALGVFFVTLMSVLAGLRAVDTGSLELNHAFGGTRFTALVKIRLWYALPSFMTGLMLAAPIAFVGALMAEFLVIGRGLGAAMVAAQESLNTERLWVIALTIALISITAYAMLAALRTAVTPWASRRTVDYRRASRSVRAPLRQVASAAAASILAAAAVVGLWYGLIAVFQLNSYFAKTPADVVHYLFLDADASAARAEIGVALGATLAKAGLGVLIGTAVAIAVVAIMLASRAVEAAALPIIVGLRTVPLLALLPVVTVMTGGGPATAVVLAAFLTVVITVITLVQAAKTLPGELLLLARAYDGGALVVARTVYRPFLTPALFTSLKITVPAALVATMSAEWLATGEGLGSLMIRAAMDSRFNAMWASFAVITVCSIAAYLLVDWAERAVRRRMA